MENKQLIGQTGPKSAGIISYWIALSPIIALLGSGFSVLCVGEIARFMLLSEQIYIYVFAFVILFLGFDLYRIITKDCKFTSIKESVKAVPELYILLGFLVWNIIATLLQRAIFGTSLAYTTIVHPEFIQEGLFAFFVYALCVWFAFGVRDASTMKKILIIFVACSVIVSFLVLLDPFNNFAVHQYGNVPYAGLFFNSNHFGYYLNLACIISAGLFIFEDSKPWLKYTMLAATIFLCFMACLVNCLGSLLATLAVFILFPIILGVKNKKFEIKTIIPLLIFVLATTAAAILAPMLNSLHTNIFVQIFGLFKDASTIVADPTSSAAAVAGTNRWGLWLEAFREIITSPIIGTGNVLLRPHNEYLQFAQVWGIPSLIIYISAFVVMLIKVIKKFKSLSPLTLILGFCVVGYLISAIFGNTMPHTVPFFALVLGFFVRLLNTNADAK